jgi:hypothetical protein
MKWNPTVCRWPAVCSRNSKGRKSGRRIRYCLEGGSLVPMSPNPWAVLNCQAIPIHRSCLQGIWIQRLRIRSRVIPNRRGGVRHLQSGLLALGVLVHWSNWSALPGSSCMSAAQLLALRAFGRYEPGDGVSCSRTSLFWLPRAVKSRRSSVVRQFHISL